MILDEISCDILKYNVLNISSFWRDVNWAHKVSEIEIK
jgi:hypothetical protein